MNDLGGYKKQPLAKSKPVGGQGENLGSKGGKSVAGVSNPKGLEPKSHGSSRPSLSQGPVEPKVGK